MGKLWKDVIAWLRAVKILPTGQGFVIALLGFYLAGLFGASDALRALFALWGALWAFARPEAWQLAKALWAQVRGRDREEWLVGTPVDLLCALAGAALFVLLAWMGPL